MFPITSLRKIKIINLSINTHLIDKILSINHCDKIILIVFKALFKGFLNVTLIKVIN